MHSCRVKPAISALPGYVFQVTDFKQLIYFARALDGDWHSMQCGFLKLDFALSTKLSTELSSGWPGFGGETKYHGRLCARRIVINLE